MDVKQHFNQFHFHFPVPNKPYGFCDVKRNTFTFLSLISRMISVNVKRDMFTFPSLISRMVSVNVKRNMFTFPSLISRMVSVTLDATRSLSRP